MARRKGMKVWDEITPAGWLSLFGNTEVITDLMMKIIEALYDSPGHINNGKNLADVLHTEYRALNAAVGWAGQKVRECIEKGEIPMAHHRRRQSGQRDNETLGETSLITREFIPIPQHKPKETEKAPWEYIFDGAETDKGIYFWGMKPAMVSAFREYREASDPVEREIKTVIAQDETSFKDETNLFSVAPAETVARIRKILNHKDAFQYKSMKPGACCAVCGLSRASLLQAVPYGIDQTRPGLLFCPTHAVLFQAHLISFSDKGELLVSPRLSETEKSQLGLHEKSHIQSSFSRRRMGAHRKIFNNESRRVK
jgi:hypothetical protein